MPSTKPEELSTRGLYTTAVDDKKGTSENTGEKVDFYKFAVEKCRVRPYRTRSYQPCGASWETVMARRQVLPRTPERVVQMQPRGDAAS
jgi:hypothetical protein